MFVEVQENGAFTVPMVNNIGEARPPAVRSMFCTLSPTELLISLLISLLGYLHFLSSVHLCRWGIFLERKTRMATSFSVHQTWMCVLYEGWPPFRLSIIKDDDPLSDHTWSSPWLTCCDFAITVTVLAQLALLVSYMGINNAWHTRLKRST